MLNFLYPRIPLLQFSWKYAYMYHCIVQYTILFTQNPCNKDFKRGGKEEGDSTAIMFPFQPLYSKFPFIFPFVCDYTHINNLCKTLTPFCKNYLSKRITLFTNVHCLTLYVPRKTHTYILTLYILMLTSLI